MILLGLLLVAGVIDTKPSPVFANITIAGHGPYRFLVDTGSETSMIDPKLAAELGLKPEYRVEIITQLTTRALPALKANTLRVGTEALPPVELVLHHLDQARGIGSDVRGLLGLNAFGHRAFTLTPGAGRFELEAERPAGETIRFERVEGRIAVKARMGEETLRLILDSGSSHVVLFRVPQAMAKVRPVSTTFGTLEGARSVVPTSWTADLHFTDKLKVGMQPAAIVQRPGTEVEGLLPAAIFKRIYVDPARGEVVLVR